MRLALSLDLGSVAQPMVAVDPSVAGTGDFDSSTASAKLLRVPYDLGAWSTVTNATRNVGQADPYGGTSGITLVEASDTGQQHLIRTSLNHPDVVLTMDVWIKPGTSNNRHWAQVFLGSAVTQFVDAQNGVAGASGGGATATLLLSTGGWEYWRISGTDSAGLTLTIFLANNTPAITYNGDGTSFLSLFQPLVYT